jgi:hypothetical protein
MKENSLDRLIGKCCKIVTKESDGEKVNVISGIIKDIDHDEGFLTIESTQGLGLLNFKTIVAIKPRSGTK